jgi:ketosteroid isomerase-like protein
MVSIILNYSPKPEIMKKTCYLLKLFLPVLLVFQSCQTTKVDTNAEADVIRQLGDKWHNAIREKDTKPIMNMLADDVVWMLEDMPIIKGKEAIRELEEAWFSDTTVLFSTLNVTCDAIEVSSSGDLAYKRVTQRLDHLTSNGTVVQISKWVDILKKIDGEWKVIIVAGNQDNPY